MRKNHNCRRRGFPWAYIFIATGIGLMLGFNTEKDVNEVVKECREKGVIVIKAKNKIRLLPALNIPWEQLKKAVEVIKEVNN